MPLAVAVVGLGRMGRFYAQIIASLAPRARLVAAADPAPAARASAAAEFGLTDVFAEPAAALDRPDVDAVIVASSAEAHAEIAIAAARAGKAVFCEKPLALSLDDTVAIRAAVEQARVPLQVGFMRRFDPAYVRAKAAIDSGQIGRPTTFKAIGRDPSCPPLSYASLDRSGGLFVDMAIHDFDLARWLMSSEVERVSAEGSLLACDELASVGDIDNAVINLRFENGALGNVEVSRNARYGYDIRTEVLGSDGAVAVGGAGWGPVEVLRPAPPSRAGNVPHFVARFSAAYRAQIEHFVDCVVRQKPPAVGGRDALAAFQIADAARTSWRTATPVSLNGSASLQGSAIDLLTRRQAEHGAIG